MKRVHYLWLLLAMGVANVLNCTFTHVRLCGWAWITPASTLTDYFSMIGRSCSLVWVTFPSVRNSMPHSLATPMAGLVFKCFLQPCAAIEWDTVPLSRIGRTVLFKTIGWRAVDSHWTCPNEEPNVEEQHSSKKLQRAQLCSNWGPGFA